MEPGQPPAMEKVAGLNVELVRRGRGRPVLFLHPHIGLRGSERFIEALGKEAQVLAFSHPGFGRSELPRSFTTVDDLAYYYLDALEELALKEVALVGVSFGAWIAMQIAIKSVERIGSITLVSPVGAKFSARDESDLLDVFTQPRAKLETLYFHDARHALVDLGDVADERIETIARNNESAAHFAWSPYMHDPKLRQRLHRIRVPALVLGAAEDRIAPPDYGRKYAAEIPGARFENIEAAGHFAHVDQPDAVAQRVLQAAAMRRAAGVSQ